MLRHVSAVLIVGSAGCALGACGGASTRQSDADGAAGDAASRGGNRSGGSGGTSAGGSAGTAGFASCDDARRAFEEELARVQSCTADEECGRVLSGTSCGCTRDLVARLDADTTRLEALEDARIDGEACISLGSTCDCPNAEGFACSGGVCTWNYVDPVPVCTLAPLGSMCVVGQPIDSGDALREGMTLMLEFRPFLCYSSSCTQRIEASCAIEEDGDDFVATAGVCLATNTDPNVACTDDCGGGGTLTCDSQAGLTAGTHTVRLQDDPALSVTFTVPSVVMDGSLCAIKDI